MRQEIGDQDISSLIVYAFFPRTEVAWHCGFLMLAYAKCCIHAHACTRATRDQTRECERTLLTVLLALLICNWTHALHQGVIREACPFAPSATLTKMSASDFYQRWEQEDGGTKKEGSLPPAVASGPGLSFVY